MSTILQKSRKRLLGRMQKFRNRYFDNFIFIHINKTAGSSIEKALRLPFEHTTALKKIEEIGREKWEKKFSFAVVRNPWDRAVSHYSYRMQTNQTDLGEKTIDFKAWLKLAYREKDPFSAITPRCS